MSDAVELDGLDDELPQYIIGIVVISRVVLSGVATLGVMAIINPLVGVPAFPVVGETGLVLIQWMAMFAVVGFIVVAVGFPVWMRLSWLIATPFSKTLRESAWEAIQDDKTYKERMAEMEAESNEGSSKEN